MLFFSAFTFYSSGEKDKATKKSTNTVKSRTDFLFQQPRANWMKSDLKRSKMHALAGNARKWNENRVDCETCKKYNTHLWFDYFAGYGKYWSTFSIFQNKQQSRFSLRWRHRNEINTRCLRFRLSWRSHHVQFLEISWHNLDSALNNNHLLATAK